MPSLFSSPPKPQPLPPIKPPPEMPDPQAQDAAKKKRISSIQPSGRSSTFLSPLDAGPKDTFGG